MRCDPREISRGRAPIMVVVINILYFLGFGVLSKCKHRLARTLIKVPPKGGAFELFSTEAIHIQFLPFISWRVLYKGVLRGVSPIWPDYELEPGHTKWRHHIMG